MTCREITALMLDAELAELSGVGDSAVARHVRGCIPCRMVARRIVGATSRLAAEVRAPETRDATHRRPGAPTRRDVLATLAVAAGVLMVAVGLGADRSPPVVSLPHVVASAERPPRPRDDRPPTRAAPLVTRAIVRAGAEAPAGSAAPVPAAVSSPTAAASPAIATVSVDVPLGKQAVVMRTANPQVTVVWLR